MRNLERRTEVLVVGAGPVGMTTALLLRERGVETAIIDSKGGPTARSYACALHPHSLELFHRLGVSDEILAAGRRLDTVAFYEGDSRRAELKLSALSTPYPFLVVLPQNLLERILERALQHRGGVAVHWHHELSHLGSELDDVVATVDQFGGTAVGYIVPRWEMIVKDTWQTWSPFLVGADGRNSQVRRCLGIDCEKLGESELFAVFEFETGARLADEMRVVLDEAGTSVLWPLPGGRCRWSFQIGHGEEEEDFPEKARRSYWIDDPENNRRVQGRLQRLITQRAPWFNLDLRNFDWVGQVQFQRRLARRAGDGQTWLVGDSVHQTGPVGVQSLNVGLREAEEVAALLKDLLERRAPKDSFEGYNARRQAEWRQLLGAEGALDVSSATGDWIKRRASRILACVPGSGGHLEELLKQLSLSLPESRLVVRGP